ncbi:MAG: DNA mismatch repair protein MutS, partial [Pseudomonadota bacterium]|nr:DNA mismatch repair protein MutS [Pseudomonadota bacterium]
QSYGLQVAALAGVPKVVIQAAKQRLRQLESGVSHSNESSATPQLGLFDTPPPLAPQLTALLETLDKLSPDEFTPRQALDKLYELKKLTDRIP